MADAGRPDGITPDEVNEAATAPAHDAKERGGAALVIIDMVAALEFPRGEELVPVAERASEAVLKLRDAADGAGLPTIYVNDNFGEWHSERSRLVDRALAGPGRRFVERLRPRDRDYFIIKPQFSGFYATNLPVLLPKLGVARLVLTGMAADICVLFTAADAHMRDYRLWVPSDAVVARTDDRHHWALEIMRHAMGAEVRGTGEMALTDWLRETA